MGSVNFASQAEAERFGELKLLERCGKIKHLELQPVFNLVVNDRLICKYRGDFCYYDLDRGVMVVEDVKGCMTKEYAIKRKLFEAVFGYSITEIQA